MNTDGSASHAARRTDDARRQAILVLGMHRSGTSAVTRCLNLLGVDLGKRLLPPAEDNSAGFWENAVAVEIHVKLLESLGRTWNDARPLPESWLLSTVAREAREQIAELVRNDFDNCTLWGIKDPRLCRFLPLWRAVLAEQNIDVSVLLVVRHPQEVAQSLLDRDGLPMDLVWLLWLQHFAEAESATRGLPRTIIGYNELLSNWKTELTRAGHDLAVTWPVSIADANTAIDSFLDRGERHHEATASHGNMPEVLAKLYSLCASRESNGINWAAISRLVDSYMELAPAFQGRAELLVENVRAVKQQGMDMETEARESLAIVEEFASRVQAARQMGTSLEDGATLYWRASDSEFSESQACTVPVKWEASSGAKLRFEVSAASGIAALRFDPSGCGGAFNLIALQLNGVAIEDLRGSVRRVNQYILDRQGGDGVWFASNDGDPWIEIDVSKLIRQGESLIIDIHCTRRMLGNVMGALMASITGEMEQRIQSNVASSLSSVTQGLSSIHDGLLKRMETLQVRGVELEQKLAVARERESQLQQTVDSLQLRHAEIEGELVSGRNRVTRLTAGIAWQMGEALKSDQDAKQSRRAMSGLQAEIAAHRDLSESLQRELAEIHASTIWRTLLKLRALLLLLPPGLRAGSRRISKAAWWAITPWRTPARMRFLKARRLASELPSVEDAVSSKSGASMPKLHDVVPPACSDSPASLQPADDGDHATDCFNEVIAGYTYRVPDPEPVVIRDKLLGLSRQTFFSVIVPVYNTDPHLLQRTIASVQAQWYPDWELILVDDHSPSIATREVLEGLADPRINVIRLAENKRISGATNEGLQRASGDYIVFLDHDDELTPDCLYELALCIDRDDPDYLYSDEDKLGVGGRFKDPFFKPDWSPDTMMSIMLTCHVSCVKRSLALEVGGLRSEYDGSQDWDFVLRVTERARHISHIPKVLYHWRTIPASCASDLQAKPYAVLASKAVREDALRRRGLSGELIPVPELPGYYRTHYHLQGKPLFSIVIPTKNNGKVLKTCIDSIFEKSAYRNFEVIVINNGSTDASALEYLAMLRGRDQVTVLDYDVPFNYSEINNYGVRHARGELLVFLNDDTEVISPEWLDYMGGYAQLQHVGAVGAKLLYPGTLTIQHTGVVNFLHGPDHAFKHIGAGDPGYFCRNLLEHDWVAVTGACLMIERKKFDVVGGFDEDLAVAYNDVALCFSLVEHGWYQVVCPSIQLLHYESLSRGDDRLDPAKLARIRREQAVLYRKHPNFKGRDPFHSANFIPDDLHFAIPGAI